MSSTPRFSLSSTAHSFPTAAYEAIKNDILGKSYSLSLTFVGATKARAYNKSHRGKTYVPNVLSFPLDTTTGEIIICPQRAKHEAHKFSLSYQGYVVYLFIHGLLHLKGYDHGATMERMEERYKRKYQVR
jgi:rRNA maturation RNase YbeY